VDIHKNENTLCWQFHNLLSLNPLVPCDSKYFVRVWSQLMQPGSCSAAAFCEGKAGCL